LRSPLEWLKARFGANKPAPRPERRTTPRQRLRFAAELGGIEGAVAATGVDIHEDGARVLSKSAWEVGTVLFLRLKDVQLGGFAEVRHCARRKDGRYSIGLAFRSPLVPQGSTWQIQRVHQVENAWTYLDDKPPEDKSREVA
jgi:hypothetical protein